MSSAPQLKTRKPTGNVAYPLILIEGVEKTGKTFAALSLSASKQVGRTFVLELDEPTADEYAALGNFEILEHNGTYSSILDQLRAATSVPMEGDRPNLIVLDTGTALWSLLKDWVNGRARSTKRAKTVLRDDPDAEIDISMNLWNDAKDRWYEVINLLRRWPGIGVIVCRGKEVAKVQNGVPVAGQTDYSIEAEKSTSFAVTAHVRMTRPHKATLVSARSLQLDIPLAGLPLDNSAPLEHLVFGVLGAGGTFAVPNLVSPSVGKSIAKAKNDLIAIFARSVSDEQKQRQEAIAIWNDAKIEAAEVSDEQWAKLTDHAAKRIAELLIIKDNPETKPAKSGAVAETAPLEPLNQREARKLLLDTLVESLGDEAIAKSIRDEIWTASKYGDQVELGPAEIEVLGLMARKRIDEFMVAEEAEAGAPNT